MYKNTSNVPEELKTHFQISRNHYNKRSLRLISGLAIGIPLILILQTILAPSIPITDIWYQFYIYTYVIIVALGIISLLKS